MKSNRGIVTGLFFGGVLGSVLGGLAAAASAAGDELPFEGECVVLLHGMARTANSMNVLANGLSSAGYRVENVDYPSREFDIESLASFAVDDGLARCGDATKVHFVTHSLGGILLRVSFRETLPANLGRVVMLGPPNQGSEIVDALGEFPGFEFLNGPAGKMLGTGPEDLPANLPEVSFDLGVIAGTRSINPLLSRYLPDPDDGKVSVASTRVEGMRDFVALPVTHTFMMRDAEVIRAVVHFLAEGRFPRYEIE